MASQLMVCNLLRRLEEFPINKADTRTAEDLLNIEKTFSQLLSHLQYAEFDHLYDNDEQGIRSKVSFDIISQWRKSIRSPNWPSEVAVCAADVEEIVISYNFHLLNMNSGTHYTTKLLNWCSFVLDSNPIISYFSTYDLQYQSKASQMIQAVFQSSAAGCVLLLQKVSELLTSTEMTERLQRLKRTRFPDHKPQTAIGNYYLSDHDSRTSQILMNLESARMVRREEEVKLLEGWLLGKEKESPDIMTISGKAGIGKTTVAEAVYEQVQKHFDCHAWVFVYRNDSTRRIMKDILKGILKSISVMAPNNIDTMGEKTLKKLINNWLIGKKFLLILDDVPSRKIIQQVIDAIPQGPITAKILVTSQGRDFNIYPKIFKLSPIYSSGLLHEGGKEFSYSVKSVVEDGIRHKIFRLSPIYSSRLLHEHACSSERGKEFFSSVQSMAEDIVELCDGVPLAIVTVGRMLSTKHKVEDWNKVRRVLKKRTFFMPLCYADLSPALKSCFLYAASFPCQFEISCKKLKRLWIAEGFVLHDNNRTLEESAQLQLEELIHRNMIQVVKRNIDGEVKTCRILPMIRDFALRRSEGVGFSAILENLRSNLPKKCHRAFLYGASNDDSSTSKFSREDFSRLYSFLAIEERQHLQPLNLNDFKLLSVLELQGFCHELLPDAVGDLVLLRYLGLRGGKIKKLPLSLKKLRRLQTLDIRDTLVRDLPDDLQGLGDLRHLLLEGSFTDKVVNLRDGIIEAFKDLQTLAGLKMTEAIAKELTHLIGIRKLSIGAVQGSHLAPLFEAVERMEFLRSFSMKGSFEDQSDKISSLPPLYALEKLSIGGPTKNNLLDWVGKLHGLKCLYLWDSKLTKDPLCALQENSNLMVLSLCNSYDGKDIEFGHGGFPKLKKLSILHCKNLENWQEITDGAMTKLETLNLGYCPSLVVLPKGLEKLNSLCSIQISNMSPQFMKDVHELQSISKVSISIRGTAQSKKFNGDIKIPPKIKLSGSLDTFSLRYLKTRSSLLSSLSSAVSVPLGTSNKIGTIQRKLARPIRKDDKHKSRKEGYAVSGESKLVEDYLYYD